MSDSERSFAMKELAPLPWKSYKTHSPLYLYRLEDAQELTVLFVPGRAGAGTGDRAKEIAEYVLCVANSHEELLAVAKAIRDSRPEYDTAEENEQLKTRLALAIARAEEGKA